MRKPCRHPTNSVPNLPQVSTRCKGSNPRVRERRGGPSRGDRPICAVLSFAFPSRLRDTPRGEGTGEFPTRPPPSLLVAMFDADRDRRVRLAAFNWLDAQVTASGDDVLSRALLAEGFPLDGLRVPLVSPQGIFKPKVLTDAPLTITTVPSGPYHDATVERRNTAELRTQNTCARTCQITVFRCRCLRIAAISAAASSWSIVTDAGGVEAHRQHDPPAKPAADQRGQPGQKPADGNPRSAQNPDAGPYRDAAISRSSARAPARIPSMP